MKNLQDERKIPITYKLSPDYIYISFDLNKVYPPKPYSYKENRIFAIDINPNYIGYSVVDWKNENKYKVIDSGVLSLKDLNDREISLKGLCSQNPRRLYITNKRTHEVRVIAHELIKIAKHYHCECFGLEQLVMNPKDNQMGKRYNRLINNQWCRTKVYQILKKLCLMENITFVEILPQFSSFIGNMVYRNEKLPDMVLSSIEIGRRAYEFNNQYLKTTKQKQKNIVFPELKLVKDRINQTLEGLKYSESWTDLKNLYYSLKNLKLKYRVSLESLNFKVFRLRNKKSFINFYSFI